MEDLNARVYEDYTTGITPVIIIDEAQLYPALFQEFAKTLYEEIDYQAEAQNVEIFAENFKDRPGVCIPRVVWSLCTDHVLVLEDVSAIKITDYQNITAARISRAEVAQRLFETYLQQIFQDGFFHADPHPGKVQKTPGASRLSKRV